MKRSAILAEEANYQLQIEAANESLTRELDRTLRCLGEESLISTFRKQVNREKCEDGRYHNAIKLLGEFSVWSSEESESINRYVNNLPPYERKARIAGSEVDAALNDPRRLTRNYLIHDYMIVN